MSSLCLSWWHQSCLDVVRDSTKPYWRMYIRKVIFVYSFILLVTGHRADLCLVSWLTWYVRHDRHVPQGSQWNDNLIPDREWIKHIREKTAGNLSWELYREREDGRSSSPLSIEHWIIYQPCNVPLSPMCPGLGVGDGSIKQQSGHFGTHFSPLW